MKFHVIHLREKAEMELGWRRGRTEIAEEKWRGGGWGGFQVRTMCMKAERPERA